MTHPETSIIKGQAELYITKPDGYYLEIHRVFGGDIYIKVKCPGETGVMLLAEEEAKQLATHILELINADQKPSQDDPSLDVTDYANPSWWRAHEYTTIMFCEIVNDILNGKDNGAGDNVEPWSSLRQRLLTLYRKISSKLYTGSYKELPIGYYWLRWRSRGPDIDGAPKGTWNWMVAYNHPTLKFQNCRGVPEYNGWTPPEYEVYLPQLEPPEILIHELRDDTK